MKKIAQTVIAADQFYTITGAAGNVVEGAVSENNGAAVQLGTYTHSANQEWAFIRVGEGVYRIQNRGTGKMLDLIMNGTANGTWLHQWEDVNSSSQMWIVEPTNDGHVKIKTQLANTKCIDTVGMTNVDGTRLQIWEDVNGENQLWSIAAVAEKKPRTHKAAEKAEQPAVSAEAAAPAEPAEKAAEKPAEKPAKKAARKPAAKKAETTAAPKAKKAAAKAEEPAAKAEEPAAKAEPAQKATRTRKAAAKKTGEQ